jgi:hypothetical protein
MKKIFSLLIACLLGVGLSSAPAQAQSGGVSASDPVIDVGTQGDWLGTYGECFYLLPWPELPCGTLPRMLPIPRLSSGI